MERRGVVLCTLGMNGYTGRRRPTGYMSRITRAVHDVKKDKKGGRKDQLRLYRFKCGICELEWVRCTEFVPRVFMLGKWWR